MGEKKSPAPAAAVGDISFERIYSQYYPSLLHYYSNKMQSIQDAEDLVNEVFLYCLRNLSRYDPSRASLSTWLFVIAESRWKNYCLRLRRADPWDDQISSFPNSNDDTEMEKAVWLEQLSECLAAALKTLDDRQRKIVILRFFEEKKPAEIADILGMDSNNVRVILHRALRLLQKEMSHFKEW